MNLTCFFGSFLPGTVSLSDKNLTDVAEVRLPTLGGHRFK